MDVSKILNVLRGRETIASRIPKVAVAEQPPEYASYLARVTNMCVAAGLKKLLQDRHFSICTLDTLCNAARVRIDGDVYRSLRCLHCVDWSDMPRELRNEVYRTLANAFAENNP